MKQPSFRWYSERSFTKEIYIWKRRYYCMVSFGRLRRVRKPVEHRQPARKQKSLLWRLLS